MSGRTLHKTDYQQPTRTLELAVIDSFQIAVLNRSRFVRKRWFTGILDLYSRSIFGIGFGLKYSESIRNCLECAVNPKDWLHLKYPYIQSLWDVHGRPDKLTVVWNGWGTEVDDVCVEYGIELLSPKFWPFALEFESLYRVLEKLPPGISLDDLLKVSLVCVNCYQQAYQPAIKATPAEKWLQGLLVPSLDPTASIQGNLRL